MPRAYAAAMAVFRRTFVTFGVVAGLVEPAYALKPATHADISRKSCTAAGLPADFCRRVATEDFDTDANEWDDLAAHAQIDAGQTACTAADITAQRVWRLATNVRVGLAALSTHRSNDDIANIGTDLGRLLHTIQDNCAHHGMPNPQHAWFSLGDFCDGTNTSPDLDPDAVACAKTETAAVMQLVATAVRARNAAPALGAGSCPEDSFGDNNNQQNICDRRFLPAPWDACSFLGEAKEWDGIDRTWNNRVVVPRLRDAAARGLAGNTAPSSICGGRETVLSPAVSAPLVDVSAGTPSCTRAHLFCAGKADDNENPFAGDVEADEVGGCSTTGGGRDGFLVVLAALVGVTRRRRVNPVR